MTAFQDDVGAATLFDQDLVRACAAMERAWLEAKPVREPS